MARPKSDKRKVSGAAAGPIIKSELPPRTPAIGRLPKLEMAAAQKPSGRGPSKKRKPSKKITYINYLSPKVIQILRAAGWLQHDQRSNDDGDEHIGTEVLAEHEIGMRIWWTVRWYLHARQTSVEPKRFRQGIQQLEQALSRFRAKMPPPGSDIIEALDSIITKVIDRDSHFEEFGSADFSAIEMHIELLSEALHYLNCLERGPGEDADRAAHAFVSELAAIFADCTNRQPTRQNNAYAADGNKAVTGPFGDFVKAVNGQLHPDFRLGNIDNLIRHVVRRRRRR
jgi:hypothetical protein